VKPSAAEGSERGNPPQGSIQRGWGITSSTRKEANGIQIIFNFVQISRVLTREGFTIKGATAEKRGGNSTRKWGGTIEK
jgi:hypothetical protein